MMLGARSASLTVQGSQTARGARSTGAMGRQTLISCQRPWVSRSASAEPRVISAKNRQVASSKSTCAPLTGARWFTGAPSGSSPRTAGAKTTTFCAPVRSRIISLDLGRVDAGHLVRIHEVGHGGGAADQGEAVAVEDQIVGDGADVVHLHPMRNVGQLSLVAFQVVDHPDPGGRVDIVQRDLDGRLGHGLASCSMCS